MSESTPEKFTNLMEKVEEARRGEDFDRKVAAEVARGWLVRTGTVYFLTRAILVALFAFVAFIVLACCAAVAWMWEIMLG